jgi:hypothetical protein
VSAHLGANRGCKLTFVYRSARAGPDLDGTCQYLLAGADCVANRILQTKDLECEK